MGRYRIEMRYDGSIESIKTTDRTDIVNGRFLELPLGKRITQLVEFESSALRDGWQAVLWRELRPIAAIVLKTCPRALRRREPVL